MLDVLFGSQNMQRVLLFLFVNGRCYGTQLHKALGAPLTPLQNALQRLEEAQILSSFYEGKTRYYQFNPTYPLLEELENLLKKAYTLLSPQDKRPYCLTQKIRQGGELSQMEAAKILVSFWQRLARVKALHIHAKTQSNEDGGWNGRGRGEVTIVKEKENVMLFHEKGSWRGQDGRETDFTNVFRWTFDRSAGVITLEHLRRGPNEPMLLFHLAPNKDQTLTSIDSHLWEGDAYFGQIYCDKHNLRLNWRVIGPRKNEELEYYYL